MALFRRFFYRKPPDRLLEITERVYGMLRVTFSCILMALYLIFCDLVNFLTSCDEFALRLNMLVNRAGPYFHVRI
ncbi:hypothetical protein SASPL_128317 [Salvia splendens]|uniref:Uncharacterized protein n=1 Tax=Salvia splendens TaxID=180675 RepID=A0A8X8ZND5_SALSN|nr:hypothetical protein SASPL_128317 [Salvia splendens]